METRLPVNKLSIILLVQAKRRDKWIATLSLLLAPPLLLQRLGNDAEGTVPLNKTCWKQAGLVHETSLDLSGLAQIHGYPWLSLLISWEVNLICFRYFTLVLRASLRRKNRHCQCKDANIILKTPSKKEPACLMPFDSLSAVYAGSHLLVWMPLIMFAQHHALLFPFQAELE